MLIGQITKFEGGSYEVRGIVDELFVVRIRYSKENKQVYELWTETERTDFDNKSKNKTDNKERNQQIYERNISGETKASLAREFNLSSTTISSICSRQARKEKIL